MNEELKKITNQTINEVLPNEVILPSTYFEKFNKNARILEIDIEDKKFEDKINSLIVQEFNTIEEYMNVIEKNISNLGEITKESKDAIKRKDYSTLNESYKKIELLEKEIQDLTSKIYKDSLTDTYNKKWFYNHYLDEKGQFKNDAVAVLLTIKDFDYIKEEYGKLIADNLVMFIIKFLKEHFVDSKEYLGEPFEKYNLLRYFDNQFIIFVEEKSKQKVNTLLLNIKQLLTNTTLKSNSGLLIKANFDYSITTVKQKEAAKGIFEELFK